MAERVCGAIATLDPRTGASFGIAALRAGTKREEALALADARLYDAKRMTGTYRDPAGLSSSGVAAVAVLEAALAAHDGDTAGHSAEVALLADRVAARLGLDETERRLVRDGARLHDLGKLAIGVELLRKPEPLSDDEWALIRTHSDRGADILDASPELRPLSAIVRACHEHWDGGGYPAGRSGTEIPLPARIVAVCDAFEAMVSPRPYTASRTIAEAIAELQRRAGTQFDATVVEAFVAEVDRAAGGVTGARPEVTAPAP
jgi:HD-GYP domain-containing protein (c-di-GMP phosphodiesterase class II)